MSPRCMSCIGQTRLPISMVSASVCLTSNLAPYERARMKLRSAVHDVDDLTYRDRDAMFALMAKNYENKHRDRFDSDLSTKRWVILVRRPGDDRIVGFS